MVGNRGYRTLLEGQSGLSSAPTGLDPISSGKMAGDRDADKGAGKDRVLSWSGLPLSPPCSNR